MPDVNIAAINAIATTRTTSDDVDKVEEEEEEDEDLWCPKNEMTVPVSVSVISTTEASFSSSSLLKQYPFRGLVGGDEDVLIAVVVTAACLTVSFCFLQFFSLKVVWLFVIIICLFFSFGGFAGKMVERMQITLSLRSCLSFFVCLVLCGKQN